MRNIWQRRSDLDPAAIAQIAAFKTLLQASIGEVVLAMLNLPRYRNQSLADVLHFIDMGKQARLLSKVAILAAACIVSDLGYSYAAAEKPDYMPTTKVSQQQAPKLKWFFDEDPRSLGIKIGSAHEVIKLLILEDVSASDSRRGRLVQISLRAKIETAGSCAINKEDDLVFFLRSPQNYRRDGEYRRDFFGNYGIESLNLLIIVHKYFAIIDCNDSQYISYAIDQQEG